jgi:hypothetical protein
MLDGVVYELLTALFERETRYHAARVILAGTVAALAGVAGFGGLEGFYVACAVAGIVAGSIRALPVIPVAAVLPAVVVDTGLGFHGDAASDYVMAAPIVFGAGALAAVVGVLAWVVVVAGSRSLAGSRSAS